MSDQPVCYLQEGDDPRDHDITDGIVCAHCYLAIAEQGEAAADVLVSLRDAFHNFESKVGEIVGRLRGYPRIPWEPTPEELEASRARIREAQKWGSFTPEPGPGEREAVERAIARLDAERDADD